MGLLCGLAAGKVCPGEVTCVPVWFCWVGPQWRVAYCIFISFRPFSSAATTTDLNHLIPLQCIRCASVVHPLRIRFSNDPCTHPQITDSQRRGYSEDGVSGGTFDSDYY